MFMKLKAAKEEKEQETCKFIEEFGEKAFIARQQLL